MSYLRNNKLLLLIIGVLLVANIGLLYFSVFNKAGKPDRPVPPPPLERVKKEVGFSEEQAVIYDSIRTNQLKNMKPLFTDVTKSKEEFFALIYNEGVSDSAISTYAAKIGEKQMALDLSTFRYFQSIKALCTEEQKPKMDSFIKQIVKRIVYNGPRRSGDKKERK